MNSFEFYSPTKVIFGKGVESQVGEEIKAWGGKKVLVHFGGGSVKRSGLLDRVEAALKAADIPYVLLGGVRPNPVLSLVHEGIALCRKEEIDFILAVGGGSTLDSAKAIAMGTLYDGDVWDIYDGKCDPAAALPTGNILTLAATGSETSEHSVVTKEEGGIKRGVGFPVLRPKFTLMNPELLYTLPPYQTACGVTDIMMHTMDRYFSHGGENELTDRLAEALLKTVIKYGAVAMKDPEDYEARSEIFWAGSLSHNDLTGLGLPGDWAPHQIEHELGGMFDVAHGAGLAAVWGAWARYVCDADYLRFARFGVNVWGLDMDYYHPEKTAEEAIAATEQYFHSIGMPINIRELLGRELTEAEIEELAVKCTFFGRRTVGNMKVLGKAELMDIYRRAQ